MRGLKGKLGAVVATAVLIGVLASAGASAQLTYTPAGAIPYGAKISRDGSTLVSANNDTLRVYTRPAGGWGPTLPAPAVVQVYGINAGADLGGVLSISDDGGRIAASAFGQSGTVVVVDRPSAGWTTATLSGWKDTALGGAVALSGDGQTLAAGGASREIVYLYTASYGGSFNSSRYEALSATVSALSLSRYGDYLGVSGISNGGSTYRTVAYHSSYDWDTDDPIDRFTLAPPADAGGAIFGHDIALSADGRTAVVMATGYASPSAAVVYELPVAAGTLAPRAILRTPGSAVSYGGSVAISGDGEGIAVAEYDWDFLDTGATGGRASFFLRPTTGWGSMAATAQLPIEPGAGAHVLLADDTRTVYVGGLGVLNRWVGDITPPTTRLTAASATPGGKDGWHVRPVAVAIAADDGATGSGVVETRCAVDPGFVPASFDDLPSRPCPYLGGLTLASTGRHVVYAASLDGSGNAGPVVALHADVDAVPPAIQLPAAITVDAPVPGGTNVQYTMGATDDWATTVPVICAPAPGAYFPVGVTTVRCNAVDQAGNVTEASFAVTVRGEPLPRTGTPGGGDGETPGGGSGGGQTPGGGQAPGGGSGGGQNPGGGSGRPAPRPRLSGLALRGRTLSVRVSAAATVRVELARCTTKRRGGKPRTSCTTVARLAAKAARAGTVRVTVPARLAAASYRVTVRAGSATPLVKTVTLHAR